MKIVISGIGGLGGYFGGQLAKHFEYSDDLEIIFMTRGDNLQVIRENGLIILILQKK
ncbi:MAG: 2-dehydropantoate 2-reductase N-terminal domain-containing protein [Saprospiraceae bacterium]